MSVTPEATRIRPFRLEAPEERLAVLRIRLGATRLPSDELSAVLIPVSEPRRS
jgi:hypothetical protein